MIVTSNQPTGTPTWIDLGIPDLERAMEFYGALFGWQFEVGPEETGRYTICLLQGKKVAALMQNQDPEAKDFWWNVYIASDDCDGTVKRAADAGGTVLMAPMDIMDQGRMALVRDPQGAQFGLWQGRAHIGAELVNEPGTLVRNDLTAPSAGPARDFYGSVFDYTFDRNEMMPDVEFIFMRRPDGHEVAGILVKPDAPDAMWTTTFQVDDADAAVERAIAAGGTSEGATAFPYGRIATIKDPFGAGFLVGSQRPAS